MELVLGIGLVGVGPELFREVGQRLIGPVVEGIGGVLMAIGLVILVIGSIYILIRAL